MNSEKILVLNGTSMAAVQALTVLDPQKYEIHVCDSNPSCWGRFHKNCARFFKSPLLGSNPRAFFDFILRRLTDETYNAILPVHEEGILLAKYYDCFRKFTNLLIADVEAFHTIMNKRKCLERAQSLGIPIPSMKIAYSLAEIERLLESPSYLKLSYGTSSSGVRRIVPGQEITVPNNFHTAQEFILQKEVVGDLCVIQSVFRDGNILGTHQYRALAKGFGGGASRRLSIERDDLIDFAQRLGSDLNWSGPLMLDFIVEEKTDSPFLIEGNPRIGETYNATLAGLNICDLLLSASLGKVPVSPLHGRAGVQSHQMLTEVMGAVKRGENLTNRWSIAVSALAGLGEYSSSTEEIIHPSQDPVSLLASLGVVIAMPFINKDMAARNDNAATKSMAATPEAVRTILESNWDCDSD